MDGVFLMGGDVRWEGFDVVKGIYLEDGGSKKVDCGRVVLDEFIFVVEDERGGLV